ncbi:MAG: hypothetical protein BJ554DRAFT_4683 [Olpidium bornovanus]|uniref:Uncharacterized protein n=1 Tax=Olpidium bornovanus TaxID=278681 RepID=A0A8H8A0C6_9FUNG|nr:MAG: hypothetical protein BJ554DRAFT_4683 [Olpidium bornovanus]
MFCPHRLPRVRRRLASPPCPCDSGAVAGRRRVREGPGAAGLAVGSRRPVRQPVVLRRRRCRRRAGVRLPEGPAGVVAAGAPPVSLVAGGFADPRGPPRLLRRASASRCCPGRPLSAWLRRVTRPACAIGDRGPRGREAGDGERREVLCIVEAVRPGLRRSLRNSIGGGPCALLLGHQRRRPGRAQADRGAREEVPPGHVPRLRQGRGGAGPGEGSQGGGEGRGRLAWRGRRIPDTVSLPLDIVRARLRLPQALSPGSRAISGHDHAARRQDGPTVGLGSLRREDPPIAPLSQKMNEALFRSRVRARLSPAGRAPMLAAKAFASAEAGRRGGEGADTPES